MRARARLGRHGHVVVGAAADATVHVRDSKDKEGARLAFADGAWTEFVAFTSER